MNIFSLKKMQLSSKFLILFSTLAVVIISTSGSGVYFIKKIKNLNDSMAPLNSSIQVTNGLVDKMNRTSLSSVELIGIVKDEDVVAKQKELSDLETLFRENFDLLSTIIESGRLDLDIHHIETIEKDFFSLIEQAIVAQRDAIEKSGLLKSVFDDFLQYKSEMEKVISMIGDRNGALINEKEDRGKTLEFSESTTLKDYSRLLASLFIEDFPLVHGANTLRGYSIQIQDVLRLYINEQSFEKLSEIQKTFESIVKKVSKQLKRMEARAQSKENQDDINTIKEAIITIEKKVLSENGIFATHQKRLSANIKLAEVQNKLKSISDDFRKEIELLNKTVNHLREEAQKVSIEGVSQAKQYISTIAVVGVLIGIVSVVFSFKIFSPIRKVVVMLRDIVEGDGDLRRRIKYDSTNEVGELAKLFNTFIARFQGIMQEIVTSTDHLNASSSELSDISQQMAASVQQTSSQSNQVASAAEEMSVNMVSVAAASEQAANNVQMMAAATEEMSTTISEIAHSTEQGRTITGEAVNQAKGISHLVIKLGDSAKDVGLVTETINKISEQTNLLALNATIEAARAGDAGKGFAVVANEIKELSKQTAAATQNIRNKIDGIQGATKHAVVEIDQIGSVIANIDEIVSNIASSMEEQSISTKEVSSNVNQVAHGIQDVNINVSQSSTTSTSIAEIIVAVNQSANEMADSSAQVRDRATELSNLSINLKHIVERYRI